MVRPYRVRVWLYAYATQCSPRSAVPDRAPRGGPFTIYIYYIGYSLCG
eukprot:SAG31_NODE_19363_length_604_cov_1.770982_1_plen_47_part_10